MIKIEMKVCFFASIYFLTSVACILMHYSQKNMKKYMKKYFLNLIVNKILFCVLRLSSPAYLTNCILCLKFSKVGLDCMKFA
jgi:hypothetical protein